MTAHDLFAAALVAYCVCSIIFPANLFLHNATLNRIGVLVSLTGLLCHTADIMVQGVLTPKTLFATVSDGWAFLAWAVVTIYLSVAFRKRLASLGAFALPIAFISALVGAVTAPRSRPILPAVPSWALALHVMTSILSVGAFAMAFGCAAAYLLQDHLLKEKRLGGIFRVLPSLGALDTTSYWLAVFGFSLLTVAVVSGAFIAADTRTTSWLSYPKTYVSLLLWILYGAYLWVRGVAGWRGRWTHATVVIAVIALSILYGGSVLLSTPSYSAPVTAGALSQR